MTNPRSNLPPALGAAVRFIARLAEAAAGNESGAPTAAAAPPDSPGARRRTRTVGVVFVHGIGNQKPDETLLDWGGTLISALAAWRQRLAADGTALAWDDAGPWPPDGVVASSLSPDGSAPSVIEVLLPGIAETAGDAGEPVRWLLTETWWAASVEPPTLGQVADWTGRDGVLGRVVFGIVGRRGRVLRRILAPGFGLFISATAFLALLGFQVLRGVAAVIPVASIRDALTAQSLGSFLVDWWGDVYVLLRDPAQAANIRGALAASIRGLRAAGADAVAVVGHSGGTIVTYTTLSDRALGDVHVDTFISHGQAISLARTIVATAPPPRGVAPADAPLGNLQTEPLGPRVAGAQDAAHLRAGRWRDFYGTQDPAPFGGPIQDCDGDDPTRRTTAVVNRLSLREDHGSYWTNDEEFVLPVLRELDMAGTSGATSRFPVVAPATVTRRHQRVAIRSAWGRAGIAVPLGALLLAVAVAGGAGGSGAGGAPGVAAAPGLIGAMGTALAGGIGAIPGADLAGGVIGPIGRAIAITAPDLPLLLSCAASFVLGSLLAFLLAVAAIPLRSWRHFRSRRGWFFAGLIDLGLSALVIGGLIAVVAAWGTGIFSLPRVGPWPAAGFLLGPVAAGAFALLTAGWGRLVRRAPALDDIATAAAVLLLALVALGLAWAVVYDPAIQAWLLGLAAVAVVTGVVIRIGLARWDVWDAHERAAARLRPDAPIVLGRRRVVAAGLVGLAVLAAVAAAVATGDGLLLATAVIVAVLVGAGLAITDVERGRPGA